MRMYLRILLLDILYGHEAARLVFMTAMKILKVVAWWLWWW